MHPDQLKTAVRDITMPNTMQQRILHNVQAAAKPKHSAPRRRASLRKRPLAVALAALLCLTLAVPALAANVSPLYELLYRISPAVAQAFQPVQHADEDNGIRMEVVAATLHGPTAELYVTLQDLQGDRVDETTDFNDSYTLYTPFDSTAHCVPVGYDAQTRTAAFLITISQQNGKDIDGGKITFSAKNFLSRKSAYDGNPGRLGRSTRQRGNPTRFSVGRHNKRNHVPGNGARSCTERFPGPRRRLERACLGRRKASPANRHPPSGKK